MGAFILLGVACVGAAIVFDVIAIAAIGIVALIPIALVAMFAGDPLRAEEKMEQARAADRAAIADPRRRELPYGADLTADGSVILTWVGWRKLAYAGGFIAAVAGAVINGEGGDAQVWCILGALVLFVRARRFLRPALVLRSEEVYQPLTGARLAWRDVTYVRLVDRRDDLYQNLLPSYYVLHAKRGTLRRRLWGRTRRALRIPVDALDISREDLSPLLHGRVHAARAAAAAEGDASRHLRLSGAAAEGTGE